MRLVLHPRLSVALQVGYLVTIALTLVLVGLMHLFSPPTLNYIRAPMYMGQAGQLFGWSNDRAFHIYHFALVSLSMLAFVNYSGLRYGHVARLRRLARFTSFVGIFGFTALLVVFTAGLVSNTMRDINPQVDRSSAFLGSYALVLVVLDVLSFVVLAFSHRQSPPKAVRA